MLTSAQQSIAVLAYIKSRLIADHSDMGLLQDPFFLANLDYNFPDLYEAYTALYGHRHDCLESLLLLVRSLAESWLTRPEWLKSNDKDKLFRSTWYTSNKMVGASCYVDIYAKNLRGLRDRIPYLRELGITYLHLMPLYKRSDKGTEDGVVATSYRQLDERVGTMYELTDLANELHEVGICLALSMAFGYTSEQHEWARKACDGDFEHAGLYWIYPDRQCLEATRDQTAENSAIAQLRDGRCVWTTSHSHQWRLNYTNPATVRAVASEMLALANAGTNVFKIDDFVGLGTKPGASIDADEDMHRLIRIFNIVAKIAAPAVLLESSVPKHTSQTVSFCNQAEFPLSDNALQMSASWEALATRKVCMLQQSLERWHNSASANEGHWVNYLRSYEEMAWLFTDQEAQEHFIDPENHKRFLNAFYIKRYPGSFARGLAHRDDLPFAQCCISGTAASLAGMESGEEHAVERLLLMYSVAFSTGGMPVFNLGDEVGQLNDYQMPREREAEQDSRWVHRPAYPADLYEEKKDETGQAGRLFKGIRQLIALRKKTEELAGGKLVTFYTGSQHILGYQRFSKRSNVLVLCNFNDHVEQISRERFAALPASTLDLVTGKTTELRSVDVTLQPHQYMWLRYD